MTSVLDKSLTIRQLQSDAKKLKEMAAYYRKMVKEFHVQKRGTLGPPNYSMTLYFQGTLEDEVTFYNRVAAFLDKLATDLMIDEDAT